MAEDAVKLCKRGHPRRGTPCKTCRCEDQRRYHQTARGRETVARYNTSGKARQAQERYRATPKRWQAWRRYQLKDQRGTIRAKLAALEREEESFLTSSEPQTRTK